MNKNMIYLLLAVSLIGCKKDFLDERPDKGLLVPTKLSDFRALLDNSAVMNLVPALARISSDELTVTTAGISGLDAVERNCYLWAADLYEGQSSIDWNYPYREVFYANIVLDGTQSLPIGSGEQQEYNWVRGSAYFHRAFAFFQLSQLFAAPYVSRTASNLPGIPLPISADVNKKHDRGTIQQTYDQIIADLLEAERLLPETVAYKSRPNKRAARGLLSRTYLIMGNYNDAERFARAVLDQQNKLLNYNTLSTTDISPFPAALPNGNDEVIFNAVLIAYFFSQSSLVGHDPLLYNSYESNDLRKSVFFTVNSSNVIRPKNSYAGTSGTFAGLANDEVYLILAECLARRNEISAAMNLLNQLLVTRWRTNTYVNLAAGSATEALDIILRERKKELITNKAARWSDLRRLNLEPRYALTLTRTVNNQTYILLPNDKRYVFPIPDNEINANGLQQNMR